MPGTIQVSVLDFLDLPSSSPSSSISIKVSMGKREYESWGKGDFSFPLINIRENLIVTLQDAGGNEISHTGVETISLVEKGVWDDFFPLEGGGHVHMKLEFMLSEEERNRIRIVRESALKKKHGGLLENSSQWQETAITVVSNIQLPLHHKHEVSDSQKTLLHTEEVSTGEVSIQAGLLSYPVNFCEDPESDNGIKERHCLAEKQTIPNEAQRNEETTSTSSVSQGIEVYLTEANSDSLAESWSPPAVVPLGCIYRKEASAPLLNSELVAAAKSNSVLSKLDEKQTSNTEKQRPLEKIPGNNDTDRSEESRSTSVVLQEDKVYLTKVNSHGSVKKIESRSSPTDVSARCMYAEEDSSPFLLPGSVISVKSFSISSKQEENQNSNTEKQGLLEKTPSNVRKMISAFESSLPQDSKSHIKPPITKSQSYQNGMESPLQNEHLKEAETENTEPLQSNSGGVVDTTIVGDLQQAPIYIRKKKLLVGFYRDLDKMKPYQDNERLKESSEPHIQSKIMSSNAQNNLKVEHKYVDTREERSPEDSIKTSTIEIATVSGQVSDDNFIIRNSCNLFMNQQDSVGTSVILGCEKEIHSIDSHAINIRSASHDILQSALCSEDEHNSFKTSGTWIFPDEAISSCITTGGKQAMDLIGGCSFEAKTHQGRISSSSEHAKEHSMNSGTDLTVNNDMKTSLKPRNPKLESAADSESSGRLVGQVIKVAIMFGFGTLVLLTRQMKNR